MTTLSVNTNPIGGTLMSLLTLVAIVGRWQIFEKNKEKGWKAIIPFYNDKIYGDISGVKGLGIADMVLGIAAWVLLTFAIFGFAATGSSSAAYIESVHGAQYYHGYSNVSSGAEVFTGASLFLLFGVLIAKMVVHAIVRYHFNKKNNYPQWWMLFWIFFPKVAEIYFGMIDGKYTLVKVDTKTTSIEPKEEIKKEDVVYIPAEEPVEEKKEADDEPFIFPDD